MQTYKISFHVFAHERILNKFRKMIADSIFTDINSETEDVLNCTVSEDKVKNVDTLTAYKVNIIAELDNKPDWIADSVKDFLNPGEFVSFFEYSVQK